MAILINRNEIFILANQLSLSVSHFARGSFPVTFASPAALSVNRMLSIVSNPRKEENFIQTEKEKVLLEPDTVYFIPAYYPARVRLDDELVFVSVQFNLDYLGVELFSFYKSFQYFYLPELVQRLNLIFDSKDSLRLALELKEHVLGLTCEILDANEGFSVESALRFAPYGAVFDHMNSHCTAHTKITDLADVMSMPRAVFTRRFTADIGMSPKHFFDRQLTRRASELLQRPHTTIREVADKLEFSSEFVFSRFFKSHTGISPSTYRKEQQSLLSIHRGV